MDKFNLDYVEMMLPCLEGVKTVLDVGALDVNGTPKPLVTSRGLAYTGADIEAGRGVDVVVDITADAAVVDKAFSGRRFDLVMTLNALEHIFEPLKALDNMLNLVRAGGYLLVVAPCVWEPHAWPSDYYRLLPDFFTRYAATRGIEVLEGSMHLSARDTGKFSSDLTVFPEEAPIRHDGYITRKLAHFARRLVSGGLKESWPRTSINVTFRRNG